MTDKQHRELARVLRNVKGKVALSGYRCDLLDELYSDWHSIEATATNCHSIKQLRTEVLWMNYEIEGATQWQVQQTFLDQPLNEPLAIFGSISTSSPRRA